jgi:hypothetical protein
VALRARRIEDEKRKSPVACDQPELLPQSSASASVTFPRFRMAPRGDVRMKVTR